MANVAVILSGCGYLDGAEIREAVLSLLYLDRHGAQVGVFAPDGTQHHAVDHLTQDETKENRNMLHEAARIARGDISALTDLNVDTYDALVIPGGFGVAKNLSDLAFKGADCTVDPLFESIIQQFYQQEKPIAAICIAPVVVAKALSGSGASLTIGEDAATAEIIHSFGCTHIEASSKECVVDVSHKIVSCSAYMRDDSLSSIAIGIEKTIESLFEMIKKNKQG